VSLLLLLLLLQVSAVAGAVSLGFMSTSMQATGEAAAAAAEDRAALAEEGAYPEAAEAGGSSSSGFKSPLLQVRCVDYVQFVVHLLLPVTMSFGLVVCQCPSRLALRTCQYTTQRHRSSARIGEGLMPVGWMARLFCSSVSGGCAQYAVVREPCCVHCCCCCCPGYLLSSFPLHAVPQQFLMLPSCSPSAAALHLSTNVQPVIQEPVPAPTTSEAGTAAAAALGSATAQALWLESHLADVINALWRLLSHDLDRVLRGAADGALRQLRDVERSDDEVTAVTVQQAAWVLGIMGKVFKVRSSLWYAISAEYLI
jgi:hypothetical protein